MDILGRTRANWGDRGETGENVDKLGTQRGQTGENDGRLGRTWTNWGEGRQTRVNINKLGIMWNGFNNLLATISVSYFALRLVVVSA